MPHPWRRKEVFWRVDMEKIGRKEREYLAHALVGIVNSFVFESLIRSEPYPLISKMDTILEIFLGGVQKMERRR